jgi:hypothetical protein
MSSEAILILGKALIWFAIPVAIAVYELWSVSRVSADRPDAEPARRSKNG